MWEKWYATITFTKLSEQKYSNVKDGEVAQTGVQWWTGSSEKVSMSSWLDTCSSVLTHRRYSTEVESG